jgi:hypothetical protein
MSGLQLTLKGKVPHVGWRVIDLGQVFTILLKNCKSCETARKEKIRKWAMISRNG